MRPWATSASSATPIDTSIPVAILGGIPARPARGWRRSQRPAGGLARPRRSDARTLTHRCLPRSPGCLLPLGRPSEPGGRRGDCQPAARQARYHSHLERAGRLPGSFRGISAGGLEKEISPRSPAATGAPLGATLTRPRLPRLARLQRDAHLPRPSVTPRAAYRPVQSLPAAGSPLGRTRPLPPPRCA